MKEETRKRIEELERRVKELEQRPQFVIYQPMPQPTFVSPTVWPQWQQPIVTCGTGVAGSVVGPLFN